MKAFYIQPVLLRGDVKHVTQLSEADTALAVNESVTMICLNSCRDNLTSFW